MKPRLMKTYGVANHVCLARSATNLFTIKKIYLDVTYAFRLFIQYVENYLINLGNLEINQPLFAWIVWDVTFVAYLWRKFNITPKIKKLFVLHAYVTSIMDAVKNVVLDLIRTKWSYVQLKIAK